jgi:heme/copper-type cytochrome/quinol oxidase subunit 2
MGELPTYLFPAIQGLFGIVIASVWAIGFLRTRNFGFLLLTFAALGECVAALVRQAVINYIFYHQPNLSVTERSNTVVIVTTVFLVIAIIFWLMVILGAILVVFRGSKAKATIEGKPPVSG